MKRLFLLIILTLLPLCANAQWEITHQNADELKGTPEQDIISYRDKDGNAIMWWSGSQELAIYMADGIFDYHIYGYTRRTDILIGLYKEGELIYKQSIMFFAEQGGKRAYINGSYSRRWKELVDMIKNHLMNVGPARFICDNHGMGDTDIVVPMFDLQEKEIAPCESTSEEPAQEEVLMEWSAED